MKKATIVAAATLVFSSGVFADQALQPMQPVAAPQPVVMDYQHCLTATGSHIKGDTCVAADGGVYDQEDLRDTGSINWASELARDPSIVMTNVRGNR